MVEGGSILHADHPRKWVIFARRFTIGDPMSSHEVGKDLKRITSPNTSGNMDSKALTRKLVHHHQQFHRASVIGPDKHKIPRPHVVAMLRTKPHARPVMQPQPPALRLFCRHFQALSTPDPHPPPVTHPPSLRLAQGMNPTVSIAAILPGQTNDGTRQQRLVRPGRRCIPHRRTRSAQCSAHPARRDTQSRLHL